MTQGISGLADRYEAEQRSRRILSDAEAAQVRIDHARARERVQRLLGQSAVVSVETSTLFRGGSAPGEPFDHQWHMPVEVESGTRRIHGEQASVYAQLGACVLGGTDKVVRYELRAYGVPESASPGKGPREPFAPQYGRLELSAELPDQLRQWDADAINDFNGALAELE